MCLHLKAVAVVRAKLVKIGNSRGVRLAKPLLEVAGLVDEVEIEAAPGVLTIRPFQPEGLIDELSSTRFDQEEWSW
jgi:antitoxin MazE